jgi:hypothetical protein
MTDDEPPPTPVEPREEFRSLSEPQVLAALDDPDPANPVAGEVARLVSAYTANFAAAVERLGYVPSSILRVAPRWPIEAVAMRLLTETIRDAATAAAKR